MLMNDQADAGQHHRGMNGGCQAKAERTGDCGFDSVFERLGHCKCHIGTGNDDGGCEGYAE